MRLRRFALVLLLVLVAGLIATPAAPAQTALSLPESEAGGGANIARAMDYLKGRQQSDGGFAEPGKDSSEMLTMWAVCGISAAGEDVNTWRKSGKSPIDYLASHASKLTKLTDLEKACLAACCDGKDPRSFGGRNLVADIKARVAADGHIGDLVNEHCWGVIALKAAGESMPDGARAWLVARQNIDGGYGYGIDTGSDPDDTGAALQALIAAGESPQGNAAKRAISYLRFCQASDAGFTFNADQSNVGSTSWAVQGLVAAGQDPSSAEWTRSGKTPLDYLASTQQSDGHFRYMKSSDANAAWMTAEALPAVSKKAYPLKPDSAPESTESSSSTQGRTDTGTNASETGAEQGQGSQGTSDLNRQPALSRKKNSVTKNAAGVKSDVPAHRNTVALFFVFCVLFLAIAALAYVLLKIYLQWKS